MRQSSWALCALWAVGGCATLHATRQTTAAPAIASAPTIYVEPLVFAVSRPIEDPVKWADHVGKWQSAYAAEVRDYARAKLGARQVVLLAPGQTVAQGVVVHSRVTAILRSGFGGFGTDRVQGEVDFVDAATGQPLLAATVEADSEGFGPQSWTFGGRLRFCSMNLARGIVTAMRTGHLPQ